MNTDKMVSDLVSQARSAVEKKSSSKDQALPVIRIRPSRGWVSLKPRELWEYRELLYFFVWKDIKVRYKQTILGGSWAVIQPFFTMVVFSLFFGKLAKVPSDGIPYPIFSYAALVPWSFFANGLNQGSNSLVGNSNLITKVYFPRMIIPASSVITSMVDLLISLGIMVYVPPASPVWVYTLGWVIAGVASGLASPAYQSLISKAVPARLRGVAFGLFSTSLGLVSLPAPWIGGFLWEKVNPQFPFLLTALASLVVILPVWLKFKVERNLDEEEAVTPPQDAPQG